MSTYIKTLLGINYFDTEENQQAQDTLEDALDESENLDMHYA